jgi:O-acetylhomoserine/O-acetylserine sulfhydrylase-like pyridoxal-dependent enzyme
VPSFGVTPGATIFVASIGFVKIQDREVTTGGPDRAFGFRTGALHAGARPDPTTRARAVPICQTSSFVFEDTADAADLFALQKYGNIYSRICNPTVAAFEERMANLEGGIGAVATASGQAAETLCFTALAGAGGHIVASASLYGGAHTLLDVTLRRLGIETTFVPAGDPDAFAAAIRPSTKCLYTEVVANPSRTVADLAALAGRAYDHGVPFVVDATLATPYLCRPMEHGADIVVHSATKFIEALRLCSHLANIGDAKTLVIHPASTTHRQLSTEALEASGVGADLVRTSAGLEDADDIIWDLDQALSATKGA